MVDDVKELTFNNKFYDVNGNAVGNYRGVIDVDFTTDKITYAKVNIGGAYSTSNASVSGSDANGEYTVSFGKFRSVRYGNSSIYRNSKKEAEIQFTGESPISINSASFTNQTVYETAHNDTSNTNAAQRAVTVTDPVPASISINPVAYEDTGVAGDDLTKNPSVTLSGTDKNASSIEVYEGSTDLGAATLALNGTWSLTTTLADGAHTNFSATATNVAQSGTTSASTSTNFVIDTASPSIAIDPTTAGFRSGARPVLTGTVSDGVGVSGVELYDGDTDLGAATINADGTWTYMDNLGSGDYANLTAVATDTAGNTASAAASYELVTGVRGQPYRALEYDIAADRSYGYTAYDQTGTPLVTATNNGDGTHTIKANADGQLLYSAGNDTMTGGGTSETFVFTPHFGQAEITDFQAAGAGHDVVDLTGTHLRTLAQVLSSTTVSQGTATIHVNGQDTITLDGVSRADIKAHRSDFLLA